MKRQYSIIPIREVKEGTVLVTDDGFTCMPDRATRKVMKDRGYLQCDTGDGTLVNAPRNSRSRLYVRCTQGRHYLDGQECHDGEHGMKTPHYVGFWIKGTEPKR